MKRFGRTITGAVSNLAAQGLPFLLLIVVTPILLRALGREQYGALVLLNLLPQIAGQLDLGLSTAAIRGYTQHYARGDRDGARRLYREALVMLVAWGITLGFAFFALHPAIAAALKLDAIAPVDSPVYLASAIAIPLSLINGATLIPLRALERYGAIARVQIIIGLSYWSVGAWWAAHGAGLTMLVAYGTFTVAVGTIALFFAGRRPEFETHRSLDATTDLMPVALGEGVPTLPLGELGSTAGTAARTTDSDTPRFLLRPFLRLGAGAFMAQAASLATFHADKLLVSALISPAAAGGYAICTSIANKILLVVASGATYTFPRAARLHAQGDHARVVTTYAFSTRISLLIAAALATPLIALAPRFLSIWIGDSFSTEFTWTFRLLTVGYAITAASVVASNIAVGIGEVVLPATFAVLGGTVTIVAVGLLAPRYGATGAACAAMIGMTQSLVFNDLIARRVGGAAARSSWPLVWRIAIVALAAGLVGRQLSLFVGGWVSLFACGAALLAFFASLWFVTFGRVDEKDLVRSLFARLQRGAPD